MGKGTILLLDQGNMDESACQEIGYIVHGLLYHLDFMV